MGRYHAIYTLPVSTLIHLDTLSGPPRRFGALSSSHPGAAVRFDVHFQFLGERKEKAPATKRGSIEEEPSVSPAGNLSTTISKSRRLRQKFARNLTGKKRRVALKSGRPPNFCGDARAKKKSSLSAKTNRPPSAVATQSLVYLSFASTLTEHLGHYSAPILTVPTLLRPAALLRH